MQMLVITANQIQAIALKQEKAFSSAKILSWQEAVFASWQQHYPDKRLLKPIEQEYVWQRCIRQFDQERMLPIDALAQAAQEAWWLMQHWRIPLQRLHRSHTQDSLWFANVAKCFEAYCQKADCCDEASALTLLLEEGKLMQETLMLYGFFSLTPLQEKFFRRIDPNFQLTTFRTLEQDLGKTGPVAAPPVFVGLDNSKCETQKTTFYAFEHSEEELQRALTWACEEYRKNPQQKIAVILPELERHRQLIESTLTLQFYDVPKPWVITVPPRLTYYGIIQTALALLTQYLSENISIENFASLLRSPYWGNMPEEKFARSALVYKLRELQVEQCDFDILIKIAEPWQSLQDKFHLLHSKVSKKPKPLKKWIENWARLLNSLNFPNTSTLNAAEIKQAERWNSLLEELSQTFTWKENFSATEALRILKKTCQKTYWDNEVNKNKPLQILGIVEATDKQFDQAWLVEATQGNIPFKVYANPLIDKKIQREYCLWGIDIALQDRWAQEAFTQLKKACENLIVSYAQEENGQIQTPAIFFGEESQALKSFPQQLKRRFQEDPSQKNISTWSHAYLPGATAAIKSQRLCSMQAFARFRLDLEPLPNPVLGLTPIERGLIVHLALQLIWQQLQTQENLLALSSEQLTQLIEKVLPLALKLVPWSRRKLLPKALLELEAKTLKNNLLEWLALEAGRPSFKIIALEKESQVLFKNMKWRLRIDRIDQLEDGKLLLIDYKTGTISTKQWQPEIFTEPQLPLYAVTSPTPFDGVAFAEIISKNLKMHGIARENISLGKMGFLKSVTDWPALLAEWKQALETLVENFTHSQATLNPLEGEATCRQCRLQSFCRVFEFEGI